MKTKPKKMKEPSAPVTKTPQTEFRLLAPQARSVFLCGDFNAWSTSSHPLQKDAEGTWKILTSLDSGVYQYRFVVDGEWKNDPDSVECVANPFGTLNCVKLVG